MVEWHRRSIRLRGYDYSQRGLYFVTVCAADHRCMFGQIVNGEMAPNEAGCVVIEEWLRTPDLRQQIQLDAYVLMPNHFHGIVVIVGNARRGVLQYAPTRGEKVFRSPSQTIGAIVRGFKSASTKRINEIRGTRGCQVWQRNYYEHIIRTGKELDQTRRYIHENPVLWPEDEENPERTL